MSPYVLLIEDDENAIELTRRAFVQQGRFEVVAFQRGREALDFLRCRGPYQERAPQDPALIILDLGLPDLPGLEILAELKSDEALRVVPVVVLTVSDQPGDQAAAAERGANFFVRKPLRHEEFETTVELIGTFWSRVASTPGRPA
ncbi:response regulator [Deinococcus peraridilitoris]|uniref:Response regulator with CheY-like receiver domain and winged-helix DNA-binding domain protein n=1 Tax=Deinococcus peraridilitoris (strain DSM 19664 / LMG 22246 / CIP 109416 / KR-200) TaxID=937777 RepID=K9ZZ10_DEIPD|nr:response regulator [Deinococcus peraridilitoris]AFZ66888.1 response regulator with CheY-like receiver domain and winged-helix DNA-binding domain protein [Deinococcus peraridilitoris DSM 19664]